MAVSAYSVAKTAPGQPKGFEEKLSCLLRIIRGVACAGLLGLGTGHAQQPEAGPYLAHVLAGGPALVKPLPKSFAVAGPRTLELWVRAAPPLPSAPQTDSLIAGIGDPSSASSIYFVFHNGYPGLSVPVASPIVAAKALSANSWHLLALSDDGRQMALYVDGVSAGTAQSPKGDLQPEIELAPDLSGKSIRFSGDIGGFSVFQGAKTAAEIAHDFEGPPDFAAELREENAKPWPMQTKQQLGYETPQAPDLMPHGAAPEAPHAKPLPSAGPTLRLKRPGAWEIAANWRLYSNADNSISPQDGASISLPGYLQPGYLMSASASGTKWMVATMPGTVLTTLIDRGVYPDPDFGLNNLAIPESLNKHDYWYRVEFPAPAVISTGRHFALHFGGINYSADVWINGHQAGAMRGAFKRGTFDVTAWLRPGVNVLAVRVAPPPHPGIPAEQSIKDGPGYDGGLMLIDGPTFVDTEGWDWMPAMRDRDTGIWQSVSLEETGQITLGDPQVITQLPLPNISTADITINVPVHNSGNATRSVVLSAAFEGVQFDSTAIVPPGDTTLHLTPVQFKQLHLMHPRLWWPNGYGAPNLYHLRLVLSAGGAISDERTFTFGVRQVTYELTLFDHSGSLQRIEANPTLTLGKDYDPVDVRHEDMRQTAAGWASTVDPAAENTPAALPILNEDGLTDLVIRVNGVRIAVRGGNWGMDDTRKRISRAHLEPYFRLHQEAHLNMIRNWVGQNTEEVFYDLADEYGLMVWNDFWASTQNYNAEPGDPQLFADNARDTVRRYRNHPSIVIWCGRNEGVPPPALNEKLVQVLHEEDGTRFYSPSSNRINLRPSGPYHWVEPGLYFSKLNRGFSVELGISSFPTREAFEHTVAAPDRWPVSDAWAYHDWHQSEGGDTHALMKELALELGPYDSLAEFERRIQLFNYVDHQAIYEGMYAHLWKPNSGRMIWMTQPAWPSTMWQMYSSDYDTQASFYAVRKANAPLHVQMDLSNYAIQLVNTTRDAARGLHVHAVVTSPDNEILDSKDQAADALANATASLFVLPVQELFEKHKLVLVRLELRNPQDELVADNFYWVAQNPADYRALDKLPTASIGSDLTPAPDEVVDGGREKVWRVRLRNTGSDAAIALKLTLLHADGTRILPAYYSDNYVSLLPGEERTISIHVPLSAVGSEEARVSLRGWNLSEQAVPPLAGTRAHSSVRGDAPLASHHRDNIHPWAPGDKNRRATD